MIIKTKVFEGDSNGYKNLTELAQAMGISVSQIYRIREGKRHINQKFIVGAMKAFPKSKLNDLFYLAPESSSMSPGKVGHSSPENNGHFTNQSSAPR